MLTDCIQYLTIFKIFFFVQTSASLPEEGYVVLNGTDLYFLDDILKIRGRMALDDPLPSSDFALTVVHSADLISVFFGPLMDGYVKELVISKTNGKVIMKKKHDSGKNVKELQVTPDKAFLFQSDGSRLISTNLVKKRYRVVYDLGEYTEIWGLQFLNHEKSLIFISYDKGLKRSKAMMYIHRNSSVALVASLTNRPLKYIYDSYTRSYVDISKEWQWDEINSNDIYLFNNRFVRIYNRRICLMNRNDLMEIVNISPEIQGKRLSFSFYGIENYSAMKNNATLRKGFVFYNISHLYFLDIGLEYWFSVKLQEKGLNYAVKMAHNSSHWIVYLLKRTSRTFTRAVISKFDHSVIFETATMAGASSGKACFGFNSKMLIFVGETKIRKFDIETFRGEMIDFELGTGPFCTVSHVITERAFYYTLCHELKKTVLLKKYDIDSDRVSLAWESNSIYCPNTIYIDPLTKEMFAEVYQEGIFKGHLSGTRFKKLIGDQEFQGLAAGPFFLYTIRKGSILKIDRNRGDITYRTEPMHGRETEIMAFDTRNNYLGIGPDLRFWPGMTVISIIFKWKWQAKRLDTDFFCKSHSFPCLIISATSREAKSLSW